jgi:hypothetical protein
MQWLYSLLQEEFIMFLSTKLLAQKTVYFQSIFITWLVISTYKLDNGPRFNILGEKHKHSGANSKAEV